MEDLLQHIPILTVCVVGMLLVIVLTVALVVMARGGCKKKQKVNPKDIESDINTEGSEQSSTSTVSFNAVKKDQPKSPKNSRAPKNNQIQPSNDPQRILRQPQEQSNTTREVLEKQLMTFFKNNNQFLKDAVFCNSKVHNSIQEFCDSMPEAEIIWISNSPNRNEADKLRHKFKQCKPVIHIGCVYKYTSRDRQGLKELVKAGFTLRVWENVSRKIYTGYDIHLGLYFQSIVEEAKECPDRERNKYTENQVSPIALGERGITHLLTNNGRLYRSTPHGKHAERVFTDCNRQELKDDISHIWIKNSPCSECSKKLSNFLTNKGQVHIHIGHIYQPHDEKHFKGMVKLSRKCRNVQFSVWKTFNDKKYIKPNYETSNYLKDVETDAQKKILE